MRSLQFFELEFKLLQLPCQLLALAAKDHAAILLNDQLQVFDLLQARIQFQVLRGKRLPMCRVRSKTLLTLLDNQHLQRFDVEPIEVWKSSNNHACSMP